MTSKFDFDAFFGGAYLKADDIDEESGLVLTIQDYSVEEVGPDKETKCLLEFQETEKKLVLNVTNGRVLGDLFGKDADDWIGKRIKLITQPVPFAGKTTVGVRIYPKLIKQAEPQPEVEAEELPF
jgi:hypothetical protein